MAKKKDPQFTLAKPPDEVFLYGTRRRQDDHEAVQDPLRIPAAQGERVAILDLSKGINGVTYPPEGGQLVWHVGRPYPRKGHVYPEALRDMHWPKRILINGMRIIASKPMIPFYVVFALLPKKLRGKIIDVVLETYVELTQDILSAHLLDPKFYIDICRELAQPAMTFLVEMGASDIPAARFVHAFITILEYDSAYRLRLEDLLTETSKEQLMKDPVGEARRLVKVLSERDYRKHLVDKFDRFAKVLRFGFWFVKKPFLKALAPVNFAKLQFDDIDRYMVRHWTGYNWFGMTIEERVKKWPVEEYPFVEMSLKK